jgi:hypothetical protein
MIFRGTSIWFSRGRHLTVALSLLVASASGANAVPSFAEQTGQPCVACHVGSFGPQLTPFGRQFKLEGYTMRSGTDFTNPVSAMAIASFVNTARDQAEPPAPHYGTNNNATIDQISVFVAGGIGEHFGGFTQWTYDGVGRAVGWDNIDLRATTHATIFATDVLAGISLNNAPGVQDGWNTLPSWGFPYTGSDLMPAPGVGTMLDGGLAQSVLGVSAFAYWDSTVYTEVGLYWTPGHNFLSALGAGADNPISGGAPYFRVAYQKDYGTQNFEVGTFALIADLFPGGDLSEGTDRYSDVGIDGSYQFMGDGNNIYSVNARYSHETQDLTATQILGGSANASDTLEDVRLDASYYWHNMIGGTVGVFNTWGSTDPVLYGGNTTFKPNSSGFIFQLDGTIFGQDMEVLEGRFNVRAGLQYTVFTKFDGASTNYDGTGRSASDNNSLRIFLWTTL